MPNCGRFNEWGCDGPGASENVRKHLSLFTCLSIYFWHAEYLRNVPNSSKYNVFP